jgi:hypothetical protein
MCVESMVPLCLFGDRNDLSDETIAKRRNNYFQKEMSKRINSLSEETMSWITRALNVHLNLGQSLIINTSEVFMSLETTSVESLSNKLVKQIENAQIRLPFNLTSNMNNETSISVRVSFCLDHFLSSNLLVLFCSLRCNP